MLSKLVCAALIGSGAVMGHSIHARDTNPPPYAKVNRDSEYGAPAAPAYSAAPANSYSAPAPSYSAPAPSYSAPAPSYSPPAPSYSAPETSYGAPAYAAPGYEAEEVVEEVGGLDLTSILIPILALIGLSLLFPTYVSVAAGRRKRSTDGESYKKVKVYFTHIKKKGSPIDFWGTEKV